MTDFKFRYNKTKKITGFSFKPQTVSYVKKELKDQRLENSLLRKQISWSKNQNIPVSDFQQFIALPKAIVDSDGLPYKGDKSKTLKIFRSRYPDSFTNILTETPQCVVIDGMFFLHTKPLLSSHKTFTDYIIYLYKKCILPYFDNNNTVEVHLVFDDQSPPLSPKDIERNRRDLKNENTSGVSFTKSSKLPSDWLKFLTNRNNKKQLVLLISEQFLLLSQNAIKLNQTFVVGGGFDNSSLSKCVVQNEIRIIKNFQTNISEGDSRVWLHTEKTLCDTVLIYSPDNDTYNIGLPFIQTLDKQVFVQLTFKKDVIYLNMNKLIHSMKNDPDLQCLSNDNHDNIPSIFQMLYIVTGCDYVSFFRDHGKTSFYQIFFKYPDFITSNNIVKGWLGILSDSDNTENAGFLAFLRLVGCEYWRKCSSAFLKDRIESPHYLFQSVFVETLSPLENHFIWLSKIRDALYCRVPSEEFFLPSNDALFLHWKRSCWVKLVWQQANQNFVHYPILNDHGWKIEKNVLSIVWDSDENLEKISNNIKLWTAGCGCLKSNCSGNQCGCRKQRKLCGPGCKCGQSCLNSNGPTMLPSGDANIQQPNEKSQVEHLYDSESDTDTDSDNMTFNDFFLEFENLGINLVELDESDLQTVITDFNTHV
ncbi:KIF4 [Mytilus coruscus]|uniref:KIF4 n=1 Tax=Mytilus coruscus TaxID=42192 RepID=A0A6J8CLK2_MYTCO|nr:KIF4 [Mytilus coruscus]